MYNDSQLFQALPENIKLITTCPLCNSQYKPSHILVLDKKGDAHLIYVRCPKCKGAIVVLYFNNAMGASSIGLVTDLNEKEVMLFKDVANIESNEILDMVEFLKDKSNINKLFS
jgi:hypothetical protein